HRQGKARQPALRRAPPAFLLAVGAASAHPSAGEQRGERSMASAATGAARPPLSTARSWWAMVIFMVALMFNYLDRQLLTLLITPIKADLGISDTVVSLLVGFAFVLFYVLAGIPVARLVDRGPRKWIIGFGITFWSLMTAACGL